MGPVSSPDHATAAYSVLLIDSNMDSREMYSFYLDRAGIYVSLASDSGEAMMRLASALPDVIVADIPLNRTEGIDLLVQLRADARTKRVPVIVLSGWADQRTPLLAKAIGAAAFILKPCSPDQLLAAVYSVLEGGQVGGPGDLG